jgi:hypothetical protein
MKYEIFGYASNMWDCVFYACYEGYAANEKFKKTLQEVYNRYPVLYTFKTRDHMCLTWAKFDNKTYTYNL